MASSDPPRILVESPARFRTYRDRPDDRRRFQMGSKVKALWQLAAVALAAALVFALSAAPVFAGNRYP